MPVFPLHAQVTGTEQMRAMANELLNISGAAQTVARTNLAQATAGMGAAIQASMTPATQAVMNLGNTLNFMAQGAEGPLRKGLASATQQLADFTAAGDLSSKKFQEFIANLSAAAARMEGEATPGAKSLTAAIQQMTTALDQSARVIQPLQRLTATMDRMASSASRLSPTQIQGLAISLRMVAQSAPREVADVLERVIPLLDKATMGMAVQEQQTRKTMLAHRGFAQQAGMSAASLLLVQSATQGVMTAMALLRGNLLFAGFGLIFMRFTIVRVMLAAMAMTVVIGGLMKAITSFTSAIRGAGAEMQKWRFEMTEQLGDIKELGGLISLVDKSTRKYGFALDEATSAAMKFRKEGLQPLIDNFELVQDFARAMGMELSEAADLVAQAIGRETGALETLGDAMGVVPEIFNESLEDLNEMARGERAEFVINLLRRYEGAADRFARTLPGAMNRVTQAFKGFIRDVTEPFARDVMAPALNGLANFVNMVAKAVQAVKAFEPAQRLWKEFVANMQIGMRILTGDAEAMNEKGFKATVVVLMLMLKLLVLLSRAFIKFAAFVRLVANAFRWFLGFIKPVFDGLRLLAQAIKALDLGARFASIKDFIVNLAGGLGQLITPSHLAALGLHAFVLAVGDAVKGTSGLGGIFARRLGGIRTAFQRFGMRLGKLFDPDATFGNLRAWPKWLARVGRNVIRFFLQDFIDPIMDLLKLKGMKKLAKEAPGEVMDLLLHAFTAPGRLMTAPITTPIRQISTILRIAFKNMFTTLPKMLRGLLTKINIGLLIAELFTRGMIEAFVPEKFQGAALLLTTAIFGAISGAITGAALTAWLGPGALVGAIVGGIVGLIASVALEVFLNERVKEAFMTGLRGLVDFLDSLIPQELKDIAGIIGRTLGSAFEEVGSAVGSAVGVLEGPTQLLIGILGSIKDAAMGFDPSRVIDFFKSIGEAFAGIKIPEIKMPDIGLDIDTGKIGDQISSLEGPFMNLMRSVAGLGASFVTLGEGLFAFATNPVNRFIFDLLVSITKLGLSVADYLLPSFGSMLGILGRVATFIGRDLVRRFQVALGTFKAVARIVKAVLTPAFDILYRILRTLARIGMAVLVNAVEALASIFQRSLAPAVQIAVGFLELFMVSLTTLLDFIANFVSLVGNLLKGDWAAAWKNAKNLVLGPLKGIERALKAQLRILDGIFDLFVVLVTGAFTFLKDTVVDTVTILVDEVVSLFTALPGMLLTAVTELTKGIIDLFVIMAGDIPKTLVGVGKALFKKGKELLKGLWDGVKEVWGDTKEWFEDLPDKVKSAIGDLADTLFDKGKALFQGLWDGIKWLWTMEIKGWLLIAEKVKSAVGDISQTLKEKGKALLRGLWDGMKWYFTTYVKVWLSIGSKVKNAVGTVTATLKQKGKDLIQGLAQGITDRYFKVTGNIHGWFKGLGTRVFNKVGSLLGTLYDRGKEVIKGFTNGIISMWNTVKETIEKVWGWIPGWMKKLFGLGSPSRLFFRYGADIMRGFALGLEQQGAIGSAMRRATGRLNMRGALGGGGFGGGTLALAGAGGGGSSTTVHIHGNVVGKDGIRQLAQEITAVQMKGFRSATRRGLYRG